MSSRKPNRLVSETSPYLLQHAQNPVDWFPWGEEAFAKAAAEDKPILLSVGYSACHWCHVMAHESFEDEVTAEVMNRDFVSVKVDREERPDVDGVYMNAVQAMTGAGGWPMTVAMTPDGKPFFGGTYYPPEDRYGHPSFKRVLTSLANAWQTRREEVIKSAEGMTQYLGQLSSLPTQTGDLSADVLEGALQNLQTSFDEVYGGFGSAPKFPPHSTLKFLLKRPEPIAQEMADLTLTKMAQGGIYDHLGGGFARYSVDAIWLVPHFEKMLYDNAQLVRRYLKAYQQTRKPLYKETAEGVLEWVKREMLDPSGGFYSALDADSEGVEGKFYVWDEGEIDTHLGEDAPLFKAYYGVSSPSNFEGKNILNVTRSKEEVARQLGVSLEAFEKRLENAEQVLFEARAKRVRPGLDDKILLSWNGLMLAAFADAGRILERKDYLDIAVKNAEFIRREMMKDGRLFHSYKNGEAKIAGLLEDYAYFGLGLVSLYQATFDAQWLLLALELADTITEHFADPENGGFFSTADDAEALIVRPKDFFDAAVPSSNGAAAELLLTLARYTDNRVWEDLAAGAIKPMVEAMRKQPNGFGTLLSALERLLAPPKEIAIFGDYEDEEVQKLLQTVHEHASPFTAIAVVEEDDPLISRLPFLQERGRVEGKPTVYTCEGGACRLPVTTPEEVEEQLRR